MIIFWYKYCCVHIIDGFARSPDFPLPPLPLLRSEGKIYFLRNHHSYNTIIRRIKMDKEVYSLCFMCSIRCPIKVLVRHGQVKWIEGNPHVPGIEQSLCPRGAAGISMLYDAQRVQYPMIRTGERGAGGWKKASWDEAIDYIARKTQENN